MKLIRTVLSMLPMFMALLFGLLFNLVVDTAGNMSAAASQDRGAPAAPVIP